jgi:hypothetical protein
MLRALVIAILYLASCSATADNRGGLSRGDALATVSRSAKSHGIDLRKYKLSTFPRELSEDGKEWSFFYLCAPGPAPPGCHFFAVVNRATGVVKFLPGE